MNTIQISNATILEYSHENPVGIVEKENSSGSYVCFRVVEKIYKQKPTSWLCIGSNGIITKIKKMNLVPGDNIILAGSIESYIDNERNRESYRVIVTNIDYNYAGKKKEKPTEKPITEDNSSSIDLSKCDIFQSSIN